MFTILLSVTIFPKPFGLTHILGAAIVFCALALNVYAKNPTSVHRALGQYQFGRIVINLFQRRSPYESFNIEVCDNIV